MHYHNKVYFPIEYVHQIQVITKAINNMAWDYTSHCIDNIKNRSIDLQKILTFINHVKLLPDSCFEFYSDNNFITKLCYRISYNNNIDLILVLTPTKRIITIYYNDRDDKHGTLNKSLYQNK